MSDIDRFLREARRAEEMLGQLRQLNEIDRIRELLSNANSAQDLIRQVQEQERFLEFHRRSHVQSAIEAMQLSASAFAQAVDPFAALSASTQALLSAYSSPAYRLATRAFESPHSIHGLLGAESSLAAAVRSLHDTVALRSTPSFTVLLDLVERGVREALEAEPTDNRLKLFFRRHLVAILLAILSLVDTHLSAYLSTAQQAEFQERVTRQLAEIQENLEIAEPPDSQSGYQFFIVGRQAPLRLRPRASSTVTAWLQPGELVAVLGRRGRWVKVSSVDPASGQTYEGWVRKKYLRR